MIEVDRSRYGKGLTQPAGPSPYYSEPRGLFAKAVFGNHPGEPPVENPSALDVIGAAFGYDNTIVNVIDWMSRPQYEFDPDFDLMDAIKGTPYESYPDLFLGVRSEREMRDVIARRQREARQARTIEAGGLFGFFAEMAAGALDPLSLIPVGGWLRAATKTGRILVRAGETAAVAGGTVAAQEAILHGTQETRTTVESVFAIAASSLVGSAIGGVVGLSGSVR